MLFHVTETHKNGVKLPREEVLAATPVLGELVIHDWLQGNADNRALRVAHLKHPTVAYFPTLLTPLFDPVLVRMTAKGFLLIGWQVHASAEGGRWEFKQGWFVTAQPINTQQLAS